MRRGLMGRACHGSGQAFPTSLKPMTLRHRVIAVALAALAIIAVLGAQLVLRYADTQRSLSEVVDTLAPASTAVADLNEDINNMERRLRIYVSSDSTGMGLLYEAAVVSAQANLEELRTLLEGREPDITLVEDVESDLAAWLATVGDPVTSAMDDGKRQGRPGDPGLPAVPVRLRPADLRHVPVVVAAHPPAEARPWTTSPRPPPGWRGPSEQPWSCCSCFRWPPTSRSAGTCSSRSPRCASSSGRPPHPATTTP